MFTIVAITTISIIYSYYMIVSFITIVTISILFLLARANTPFRPHPSCLGKINKGIREYKSPTPVKLYIYFKFIEDLQ